MVPEGPESSVWAASGDDSAEATNVACVGSVPGGRAAEAAEAGMDAQTSTTDQPLESASASEPQRIRAGDFVVVVKGRECGESGQVVMAMDGLVWIRARDRDLPSPLWEANIRLA